MVKHRALTGLVIALGSLLAAQPLPAGDPDRLVVTGHGREPSRVLLRRLPQKE